MKVTKAEASASEALKIVCPHCSAGPGLGCRTPSGAPLRWLHVSRMTRALELKAAS